MEFNIEFTNMLEVTSSLRSTSTELTDEIRLTMENISEKLLGRVQEKLSGEVLNIQTGELITSVEAYVEEDGSEISAIVGLPDPPPYAAIHEFGGEISHPGGTALSPFTGMFISNAEAFTLELRGFRPKRTSPHSIYIPERSYLRSSLEEMEPEIYADVDTAISTSVER